MSGLVIIFETHSTTFDNEAERATGWLPGELSATGQRQAVELGLRIGERDVDAVVASDLDRARETAEIACAELDLPTFYDWRLRECDYGLFNGAPKSEVLGERLGKFLRSPYPSGESWVRALDRVDRALDDLCDLLPGGRIVLIGHVATRWALRRRTERVSVEELAAEDFTWQPGWEFRLD